MREHLSLWPRQAWKRLPRTACRRVGPTLLLMTAALLLCAPGARAQIIPQEENGRTVWVNDATPEQKAALRAARPQPARVLVYWSNTEKRWKPAPPPNTRTMRSARSAAAEVNRLMARPAAPAPSGGTRAVSSAAIDTAIAQAAARHGVDANLVRSVVRVESNFNPNAVSHKGAMGLMQLMPATAHSLNVTDPFDVQQNVDGGVRHLKHLLQNFNGDVRLSLAAYNAGAGAVQRHAGVPPYRETRNYVKRITEMYGGGQSAGTSFRAPIRMGRDADGTLRISNTD